MAQWTRRKGQGRELGMGGGSGERRSLGSIFIYVHRDHKDY